MFMKGEYDQMKETLKIDEALAPSSEDEEDPYITQNKKERRKISRKGGAYRKSKLSKAASRQ